MERALVILAKFQAGMAQTDIATELEISPAAVHQSLKRFYGASRLHEVMMEMRRSKSGPSSTFRAAQRNSRTELAARYVELIRSGNRMVDIAKAVGTTRERVRQVLRSTLTRDELQALWRQHRPLRLKLLEPRGTCVVCLDTIWPRKGACTKTCSAECAEDYSLLRRYINPDERERHRMAMANWAEKHQGRLDHIQRAYYKRVLAGKVKSRKPYGPLVGTLTYERWELVKAKRAARERQSA